MHDINKPITLEDLTNPDKTRTIMKSFDKKDSLVKEREAALKKSKKRKNINHSLRKNMAVLSDKWIKKQHFQQV